MKLKSAVFLNAFNLALTHLKTKMTVAQLAKLDLKVEQGMFALFTELGSGVNAADNVGGVDAAVLHFFKTLTDSAALAEEAVFVFNKELTEAAGVTDSHIVSYGKVPEDTAAVTDVLSKGFPRAFADSAAITDVLSKGFPREFTEAPALTDTLGPIGLGKGLNETPALTDAITARALTKALANSVDATDDVDGAASILDDQEMQFVKNTTNVATITEVIAIATTFNRAFADSFGVTDGDVLDFGKRPSDTTSMTDAGSLRSQGYCDFTYFQEAYVGASRTF